jgi:hypothetical protein
MLVFYPATAARKPALAGGAACLAGGAALFGRIALEARVLAHASVLGVEVVVGQAAFVQACPRLMCLGLGALCLGDPLGLLGTRGPVRSLFAVGICDLTPAALELALAAPGADSRHQEGDEQDDDEDYDDDGDDGSGTHACGVPGPPGAKLWLA